MKTRHKIILVLGVFFLLPSATIASLALVLPLEPAATYNSDNCWYEVNGIMQPCPPWETQIPPCPVDGITWPCEIKTERFVFFLTFLVTASPLFITGAVLSIIIRRYDRKRGIERDKG